MNAYDREAELMSEVRRLRALLQEWRFSQHPPECPCKLCKKTKELFPQLPYHPDQGMPT